MSENSSYFELQIKINPDIEDILSDICFENLPCEGVVLAEETYKDLEMIATTEGTLRVFLTGDGLEPDALKLQVETLLTEQRELLKSRGLSEEELGSWAFTFDEKANEDWSRKWKEKWDVTHVTDRITVVPDWLEYSPHREDEVIIRLEPGCAFGTGTHATTQLCMKAIEKYMPQHAEVADIGTGSGILAVCAKKFGADYVYGCDIDDTVIDVAKENAVKNLEKIFTIPQGEGTDSSAPTTSLGVDFELNTADKINRKFDFVMANILHNVLAEIMGDLKNLLKDDAYLSLSGILEEKKPVVLNAINNYGLKIVEELHQNQWVSFVVRK